MTSSRRVTLALLLLLAACAEDKPKRWSEATEVADLARAVEVAQSAFEGARTAPGPYRLIGAQQLVDPAGVWRVTYKPESLMRVGSPVGAGGEVFVNVNVEKGSTEVRYGE